MGTETTKVVLDLDNAEFVSKMKETMGLMENFGKAEELVGLVTKLGELGAVAAVVYVAYQAISGAVNWVEEAEQINQINAAFETLAQQAGLSADILKNDLLKSVQGLADETTVLKAATQELVLMGKNAEKLPQIMDVARKATLLFGGDLISNFNNISAAMNNGNIRMLKHYGIVVDADKATKEYAKSIGIGTEQLTQAGHRQAIFNAALDQAQEKFANVDTSITATSQAATKIGVSLTDIKESAMKAWEALAGPTVAGVVTAISDKLESLSTRLKAAFGSGETKQVAGIKLLEDQIALLSMRIEKEENSLVPLGKWLGITEKQKIKLEEMKSQLREINDEHQRTAQLLSKTTGKEKEEDPNEKSKNLEKTKELHDKFEKDLLNLRKSRLAAEEKIEVDAVKLKEIYDAEKINLEKEAQHKILELKKQFVEGDKIRNVASEKEFADAKKEINRKLYADLTAMKNKYYEADAVAAKNELERTKYTTDGFKNGWKSAAADATKANADFGAMGTKTFAAVNKNASAAFKAMGDGSKTAGEAMKSFMFGALGDIATAKGEVMLADGIGSFNPIQIAEGGVLLALGSMLSSMGSGGGSVSAGGGSGGGGSSSSPSTGDSGTPTAGPTAAPQKKTVTVQIMGHYFETEQTRTKMMDMIRQAGDFTDFNLKQIGQP